MSAAEPGFGARYPHARAGLIGLLGVALVVALAMNAGRLPFLGGGGGRTLEARFTEIGGLLPGDPVQVAGVDVGRVESLEMGRGYITVSFTVDGPVRLGDRTRAAIRVSDILGSKLVEVLPAGTGTLHGTIPVERTEPPYDLTTAFGDLTRSVQKIDTGAMERALRAIDRTFRGSGPDVRQALKGMAGFSRAVAARDDELTRLIQRSDTLTGSLAASSSEITGLLHSSRLLLGELQRRRSALHGLVVHTRQLAAQLRGLVTDNRATLAPALAALDRVAGQLASRQQELRATLRGVATFARVFVNTIGNGPWFDSYIGNAPDTLKLEAPQ